MNNREVYDALVKVIDEDSIRLSAPMKEYTSFRAGGEAAVLVNPKDQAQLFSTVEYLVKNDVPYIVMGNGSNLLFKDEGFDGVVVRIAEGISRIRVEGGIIFAEAGALLSTVSRIAMENSLSGLEFAAGIPGSLGGAVFMNAGAYGGEMKDVVLSTMSINQSGMVKDRKIGDMNMGYRRSVFQDTGEVVVGIKMYLTSGDQDEIKEKMKTLMTKRNEKQPVNLPSAGSFFKRPEGHYAGKLIEDSGLKGLALGGARVSDKHAGFIVNENNATATDIINLMKIVQNTVYDKFEVMLEPEVRIIG